MICSSLEEVRSNIDRIDNEIIRLIAERTDYVKQASSFKKNEEGVKAPNRVEAVIAKVRDKASEYGANPDMAERLYREMISSFISMEMNEFKKNNTSVEKEVNRTLMSEKFAVINETDLKEIMTLFKEVFEGEPWNHDWSDEEQFKKYIYENMTIPNALHYGLYKNEKLIAFTIGKVNHYWEGTSYYIQWLGVARDEQGKGTGTKFLNYIEEDIKKRGMWCFFLQTETDKKAYSFYKKLGFQEEGSPVSLYKIIDEDEV